MARHAATYLTVGGIALALFGAALGWGMMFFSAAGSSGPGSTVAPPTPAAQTWAGTVHDAGPTGATLRSAPAVTADSEAGHAADNTVLHVACGQTGDLAVEGGSSISQLSSTWLRTDQNQYVSVLYINVDMGGKTTIPNCVPGQPELSLIPKIPVGVTTTPGETTDASSRSATTTAATTPPSTTPPDTTTTEHSPLPGEPGYHPCDDPKNAAVCDYNMSKAAATPGWQPGNN